MPITVGKSVTAFTLLKQGGSTEFASNMTQCISLSGWHAHIRFPRSAELKMSTPPAVLAFFLAFF